ncbi:MAG: hypothetical protein ACLQEI_07215 [Terriglobales bacterium]
MQQLYVPRMRHRIDRATLSRLREMPSAHALALVSIHIKADPSYRPVRNATSRRWHAHTAQGDFEIITTGVKWYDTRARVGGGGAIDLVMHVDALPFVQAARRLQGLAHEHG